MTDDSNALTPEERRMLTPNRAPRKANLPTRQTSLDPAVSKRVAQQRPKREPVSTEEYAKRLARDRKRDSVLLEEQKKKRLVASEEDWRKLVGPRFRGATTENPTIVQRVNRIAAGSDAPTSVILYGKQLGTGKAQPLSEPVLTPTGFVPMGEIEVGSLVIGSDGRPTTVTDVFPQGVRPIYQITFDDESTVYADADHLWYVYDDLEDVYKTLTTAALQEQGLLHLTDAYLRFALPLTPPIQYATRQFEINPYDGVFEIVNTHWDREAQVGLGDYLLGDVQQRLRALSAVMDAAGDTGGEDPNLSSIYLAQGNLTDDIIELIRSLGGKARSGAYVDKGKLTYRIIFTVPDLQTYTDLGHGDAWLPKNPSLFQRKILGITYSHDEVAQCIKVAAKDHLYVTRNYVLTHNTWQGYAFINLAIKSGAVSPGQVYAGTENAVLGRISVAGFNRSAYMEELLNPKYKIYFIDDVGLGHFGAGNSDQSRRQVWYELINHVYMHDLTIILTTNKDIKPESLGEWIGEQAYDRLRGLVGVNGLIEPGKVNRRPGIAEEREAKERR